LLSWSHIRLAASTLRLHSICRAPLCRTQPRGHMIPFVTTISGNNAHPSVQVCRGTGVKVMMRPLGPGMMQQIQQPCDHCKQTGYAPPSHDLCKDCSGKVTPPPPPSPILTLCEEETVTSFQPHQADWITYCHCWTSTQVTDIQSSNLMVIS
jgi:hypothetical protein